MLQYLDSVTPFWVKLGAPIVVFLGQAAAGDVFSGQGHSAVQQYSFVGGAVAVIAVLYNALLAEQKGRAADRDKHDQKMEATWATHNEAIKTLTLDAVAAINKQADAVSKLSGLTEEQTNYFKTVTRNIVEEKLGGKRPQLPA